MEPMYWLIVFAALLVIEILTMGLTTIWFAGGAVAALAANLLGGNIWVQIAVFLVFSFILLVFTRPFAAKYINRGKVKTNADELIGMEAIVTEPIDNLKSTGKAQVKGLEWTARGAGANAVIAKDSVVEIQAIEGVKLIVKEKESKK